MSESTFSTIASSHPTPRRPSRAAWLIAAAFLATLYATSPNFRWQAMSEKADLFGGDFLQEWVGGHIVRHGDYERFYDPQYASEIEHDPSLVGFTWDGSRYLPMVYPPFYYALVSPFSALPYPVAVAVWSLLLLSCLLFTHLTLVRALGVGRLLHASRGTATGPLQILSAQPAWLLVLALLFPPLIESLVSCQKSVIVLLLFTATYALLRCSRHFTAGAVFGLVAFKPQLALVVPFVMLFKGQWRFIAGGLTTGLALGILSLLLGTDVCGQYVAFATGTADYMSNAGYDLHKSHCLFGFFALLLPGASTSVVKTLTVAAGAGTILLMAHTLRGRLDTTTPAFKRSFVAMCVATLLLSPHLFTYDLTLLLLPFALLLPWNSENDGGRTRAAIGILAAALFLLPSVSVSVAARTGFQATVPCMVALLALMPRIETRPTTAAAS